MFCRPRALFVCFNILKLQFEKRILNTATPQDVSRYLATTKIVTTAAALLNPESFGAEIC